jgi:hypothetical protein
MTLNEETGGEKFPKECPSNNFPTIGNARVAEWGKTNFGVSMSPSLSQSYPETHPRMLDGP